MSKWTAHTFHGNSQHPSFDHQQAKCKSGGASTQGSTVMHSERKTGQDFSCRSHSCFVTVLSDGAHQVPPQPAQFPWLLLHHPEAQPPPHELDHLQQLWAAGGGAGAWVGAGVGAGAGVGCAGPVTWASKQEMNVSGPAPHVLLRLEPLAAAYSSSEKLSVFFPLLLTSLHVLPVFQIHRPKACPVGHENQEGT